MALNHIQTSYSTKYEALEAELLVQEAEKQALDEVLGKANGAVSKFGHSLLYKMQKFIYPNRVNHILKTNKEELQAKVQGHYQDLHEAGSIFKTPQLEEVETIAMELPKIPSTHEGSALLRYIYENKGNFPKYEEFVSGAKGLNSIDDIFSLAVKTIHEETLTKKDDKGEPILASGKKQYLYDEPEGKMLFLQERATFQRYCAQYQTLSTLPAPSENERIAKFDKEGNVQMKHGMKERALMLGKFGINVLGGAVARNTLMGVGMLAGVTTFGLTIGAGALTSAGLKKLEQYQRNITPERFSAALFTGIAKDLQQQSHLDLVPKYLELGKGKSSLQEIKAFLLSSERSKEELASLYQVLKNIHDENEKVENANIDKKHTAPGTLSFVTKLHISEMSRTCVEGIQSQIKAEELKSSANAPLSGQDILTCNLNDKAITTAKAGSPRLVLDKMKKYYKGQDRMEVFQSSIFGAMGSGVGYMAAPIVNWATETVSYGVLKLPSAIWHDLWGDGIKNVTTPIPKIDTAHLESLQKEALSINTATAQLASNSTSITSSHALEGAAGATMKGAAKEELVKIAESHAPVASTGRDITQNVGSGGWPSAQEVGEGIGGFAGSFGEYLPQNLTVEALMKLSPVDGLFHLMGGMYKSFTGGGENMFTQSHIGESVFNFLKEQFIPSNALSYEEMGIMQRMIARVKEVNSKEAFAALFYLVVVGQLYRLLKKNSYGKEAAEALENLTKNMVGMVEGILFHRYTVRSALATLPIPAAALGAVYFGTAKVFSSGASLLFGIKGSKK